MPPEEITLTGDEIERLQQFAALGAAHARIRLLERILGECEKFLCAHHDSRLMTFRGECPVCSENQTRTYPDNIFGRIEATLGRARTPEPEPKRRHILIEKIADDSANQ